MGDDAGLEHEDIRLHPVDGYISWRDGRCLVCGAVTYGTDVGYAPTPALDETSDYYVWCSNQGCLHYDGTCVGDMECPPPWANHTRD
jgi:hypothetical protein